MKKLFSALLAFVLVFSLFACSSNSPQSSPSASPSVSVSASASSPATAANAVQTAAMNYFANFKANPAIQWKDLFAKIDAGSNPFLVDIRQKADYDKGHIKGATLAAWGSDLAAKVAMLPTDKPVYVYCYSGQTAGQTVALLRMLGVDAYSVQSGFTYGAMTVAGYEKYVETAPHDLSNANANFDPAVLKYVQDYFNSVADKANFQISPADADKALAAGTSVLVDVRQAKDYTAAHVDGAINIPFAQGMQTSFSTLPKDKQLIVACYTGQTAAQTTAVLRALGYNAVAMQFGMTGAKGWSYYIRSTAANNYFANFTSNPAIQWKDLFAKIDSGANPFIVDIRQKADYDKGHIKSAANAAWGSDLASKVSMLPTDKPVYVYCYSGQTAGQTVALLRMLGIDAYSVQSGFTYGAMKTDGYEKYVETTPHDLSNAGAKFNPFLLNDVAAYFNTVADNANFQISPADAQKLVDAGKITFVDVRQAKDYTAGHVKGAVNIPFGKDMQKSFTNLPANQQIIVTCYTGQTAAQTVAVLRMLGYNAVSLQFGMTGEKGWIPSGLPVVTD